MSRRFDLESKGIVLSVDLRLQLSITDSKPLPSRMPPPPSHQREAGQQLGTFLRNRRLEGKFSLPHHERIVEIFQQYPTLASVPFGSRRWDRACPLFHLAGAKGVTAETLQVVYSLYPEAVKQCRMQDNYFPLHYACDAAASVEVIRFLLDEYPDAVSIPCEAKGWLPIHYAVTKYTTSLDALELLMKAYPDCTQVLDDSDRSVLDIAVMQSCNERLVEFLVQNGDWSRLYIGTKGDIYMVDPNVLKRCLSLVLPHISELKWTVDRPSDDPHIQAIVEAILEHASSPTTNNHKISLDLMVTLAMESLFWKNVILPLSGTCLFHSWKLALRFPRNGMKGPQDCKQFSAQYRQIWMNFASNLQSLSLENYTLSSTVLTDLIESTKAPSCQLQRLELRMLRFSDEDEPMDMCSGSVWRHSRLTSLSIYNCHFLSLWFDRDAKPCPLQWLLGDCVTQMPCLSNLELIFRSHIDPEFDNDHERDEYRRNRDTDVEPVFPPIEATNVTNELTAILQQGRLEALAVEGVRVDIEPICRVLKSTPRPPLRKYHVGSSLETPQQLLEFAKLFPDNHSLQDVLVPTDSVEGQCISYQAALNSCGRARLRPETLTEECLVELLLKANDASVPAHQIQYEFLRLVPGAWCG